MPNRFDFSLFKKKLPARDNIPIISITTLSGPPGNPEDADWTIVGTAVSDGNGVGSIEGVIVGYGEGVTFFTGFAVGVGVEVVWDVGAGVVVTVDVGSGVGV